MDLIERLKKKKIINEDNTFNSNREERTEATKQYRDYSERLPINKYNGGIQTNNPNTRHINANEINKNAFNLINDNFNQFKQYGSQFKYNPIKTSMSIWDRVQEIKRNNFEVHQPSSIEERMQSYTNFQKVKEARSQNKQQVEIGLQQRKQDQINQLQQQMKQLEEQENKISQNNPKIPTEDSKDRYNKQIPSINNVEYSLSSKEEIEEAKKATAEKLYELTNGKIDNRLQFQKSMDTLGTTAGNIGLGVLESVNNIERFTEKGSQVATKKLISKTLQNKGITKETADTVGKMLSDEGIKQYEDKILDVKTSKQNDEMLNKAVQKNIQKGGSLAELGEQLGSNAGSMAIGAFNPLVGSAFAFGSAGGSYIKDAEQRGMTDEQQLKYAVPMAFAEAGTEYIGLEPLSKAGKGAKALIKGSKAISKDVATDTAKQVLKNYGVSIADNMIQEAIIEPIQEKTAEIVGGKDKANWDKMPQRMLESGVKGGLFAMITGGASLGIQSCVGVVQKANSGQEITEQEFKTAIEDANKRINPKETISNYIKENIANQNAQNWINKAQDIINQENNQQIPQQQNQNALEANVARDNAQLSLQQDNIDNFKNGLEKFKSGKFKQTDNIEVLNKLPEYFYNYGFDTEYSLNLNMDKLKTIMKEPKGTFNGKNQHGITMDIIEDLPRAISNPLNVIKNPKYNNRFVIVTDLTDQYGDIVVVPVEINTNSSVAEVTGINKITSIYGKETYDTPAKNDVESYMEQNKDNIIYDIDNERSSNSNYRLQLPSETNTASNITNSISQTQPKVNDSTITNNYMQNNKNNTQLPTKQKPNLPSKGEEINYMEMERPEGKIRKHYRSIIESSNTTPEAKAIAKELMGTDTYVPESNTKQLNEADRRISQNGADNELKALTMLSDRLDSKITANDIAVGERLIEYYSKIGDKAKLQEAIQSTAMAGTQAGQTVQALSLLNHQTPQGQVTWIQRSVDKMNKELTNKRGSKAQQFDFTPEMQQKILKTENQQEMNKTLNEVYQELGQQVSKSRIEQLDSWRYFSMLANPRTHIRNIVGNLAMGKTQGIKNKIAGAIEGTVAQFNPNMERTHTLKPASRETKKFAKNDIVNVADRLELNDNKYNPKSRLEGSMRTFKSDAMEKTLGKLFDLNGKALEVEDAWGLKAGYVKSLSEYMTANKLKPDTITDAQLAKARNYAIEQAKEATFHSQNAIATAINQFSRKNKLTKGLTDAVLPFVKTPMNVAKAGLEYNPAGLIKTLTTDTVKLRKGNITVNKYIDNLSKGLTGTGIAVLGYAMAEAGILKASGGEDDKKEKYDEALGRQAYSIQIGDKTYSLDWLAPAGIPLFVGAEAHNINKAGKNEKTSISNDDDKKSKQIIDSLENWANAMTNSMSPMSEMSMISGLTSALKSYDQDSTKMLGQMGTNAVKSYVNQYVPTALGQIAKTTDEYERSTTSTKKDMLSKAIDQTKLQVMSKIPGLRQQLPIKTDIWGNEQKQEGGAVTKAIRNGVVPFTVKSVNNSSVDKELNDLYTKTGESSILPTTSLDKTFTINSQNYRMTNEEYNKYKNNYGKTSYKLLENLIKTKEYNNLNDEQKQKAIENIYKYAKEVNKIDYAKNNKIEVKTSTLYNTMKELVSVKGGQSAYLDYSAKTQGMEKEKDKIKYLESTGYSDKAKQVIYENCIKSKPKDGEVDLYKALKENGIKINEYLKYLQQDFKSDKEDNGTLNGKSVSGSKKEKLYEYVNNNISGYENRLIILGSQYKLSSKEKQKLYNTINNLPNTTKDEKMKLLNKMQGFTVYKNGTVKF